MITKSQVVDLLSLVAAHDQRTVGQADVEAWYGVAVRAEWTYPLAVRAIEDFHDRQATQGIMRPAHVTDAIDAARRAVRRTILNTPVDPPRELADHPGAEIAWRRERMEQLKQWGLDAWARREAIPAPNAVPELPAGTEPPTEIVRLAEARVELDAMHRTQPSEETEHA